MTDTRTLLNKISAFRQRLESMPRLVAAPAPNVPGPGSATNDEILHTKIAAGSRTQAVLEQSIRHLHRESTAEQLVPTQLIAKAKRLLVEAHEIVQCMRSMADDPLLAGPPEQDLEEIDPLAIFYRE